MRNFRRGLGLAGWVVAGVLVAVSALSPVPVRSEPPADTPNPDTPRGSASVIDDVVVNFINEQIEKQWAENKITPSKTASDYEWLRRVHLDIAGRIPTIAEITAFQKRPAEKRRREEIRYLLQSEDYARNWANIWTVWLVTRTTQPGTDRQRLRLWLEECFSVNKRYDQMVTELLTASGKANENGPVNFLLSNFGVERVPNDKRMEEGQYEMHPATARVTRLFLGIQTQCTQCHDHPFIDSRKQSSYWGVNAFFRQIERTPELIEVRQQDSVGQYYTLRDNPDVNRDGGVFYEKRNGLLLRTSPTWLDGTRLVLTSDMNRRQELARFLIRDEMFAKAIVNRMWAHFMGRGFTNPVDDFGEHNPVSHPELLDGLARYFIAADYDIQRLITWITRSKPYHLSSIANESNKKPDAEPYFARMLLKAMSPEQLVDSIFVATNAERTRATKEERQKMYEEWLSDFTVNFGDDEGNERTFNGTVVQALLLMNGSKLNGAIRKQSGSTIAEVSNLKPGAAIQRLYLAALTRPPTPAEAALANRLVNYNTTRDPANAYQDILWALLNSNEFILNH
ncbi:MAG: DUF1549 and DUF1553 domain-containing protein [Gemmatales bacterium]|nr:DUF1549 and DUF1553 domain-containing protein [Gemmatales bacterium]MDW8386598.1 DUF1549 domain-containing protein [Gemmatales bacterium]